MRIEPILVFITTRKLDICFYLPQNKTFSKNMSLLSLRSYLEKFRIIKILSHSYAIPYISLVSVAVVKHYNQGTYKKKGLWFQGDTNLLPSQTGGVQQAGLCVRGGNESLHLWLQAWSQESKPEIGKVPWSQSLPPVFCFLTTESSVNSPSIGDQVFKYSKLWATQLFQIPHISSENDFWEFIMQTSLFGAVSVAVPWVHIDWIIYLRCSDELWCDCSQGLKFPRTDEACSKVLLSERRY